MPPIKVVPHKQERKRRRDEMIVLWFIGFEMMSVEADGKARIGPIFAQGRAYTLPKLGESIKVDAVLARDLIAKSRWAGKDTLIPASAGGERMAGFLRQALEEGTPLSELSLERHQTKANLSHLTDEDLMQELDLRKRSNTVTPVAETAEVKEESAPKVKPEAAPKAEADSTVKKNARNKK